MGRWLPLALSLAAILAVVLLPDPPESRLAALMSGELLERPILQAAGSETEDPPTLVQVVLSKAGREDGREAQGQGKPASHGPPG